MAHETDYDQYTIRSEYNRSFVPAQQNQSCSSNSKSSRGVLDHNLTGHEVKKFYESVINEQDDDCNVLSLHTNVVESSYQSPPQYIDLVKLEPDCSIKKELTPDNSISQRSRDKSSNQFDYRRWVNNLLKLSSSGNVIKLRALVDSVRYKDNFIDLLNSIDPYGWTALMCAAAEGHLKVVQYLMGQGCTYLDVYESSGKDLFDICKQKQQTDILNYLVHLETSKKKKKKTVAERRNECTDKKIVCDLCGEEFLSNKQKQHEASMLHIFKDVNKTPANVLSIPEHNVGFQMMLRSGWSIDKGLGPEGSGRKNPIKTVLKQDRAGLGLIDNAKKRVSHFNAFDNAAVKRSKETVENKRVQKKFSKKTYERKMKREKDWEINMRYHMSNDYL